MDAFTVGNFGKGESRTEVSKQWIARPADQKFTSLTDLRTSVAARREAAIETTIDIRKVEFLAPEPKVREDMNKMALGLPGGEVVHPTHWSFGQLAALAKAPASYLRTIPSQIAADALTYGMRYNRPGDSAKMYANGTTTELMAATGADYGRIYDEEVVDAVMQVAGNGIGDSRWKVPGTLDWATSKYDPETPVTKDTTTLFASDRDVFMFLVDDRNPIEVGKLANGDPDMMFRGFYISNSEVGKSALKLAAFYLRAVCCNRILWGVEGFEEISMRHSKLAPSRFIEQARPALSSFADGSARKLIEGVNMAKAAKVASDDEEMMSFLTNRDFSRKRATEIMESVEHHEGRKARTIWDVTQGITRISQEILHTDERTDFERQAKVLLDKVA